MDLVKARRYHTIKGALNQFESIYRTNKTAVDANLNRVVARWTSNNAFEHYVMFDSVPMPKRWDRGQSRRRQSFQEYLVTIENLAFELTIPWHRYDEDDDQTQSIRARVSQGAARFAYLEEKLFVELITATPDDLSYIPKCFDGYDLYSTGSGTRFGLTGGNILTGASGAGTTPLDFLSDFNRVMQMFIQMKDTKNQPYHESQYLNKPLVVVPPALRENAIKAQNQQMMAVRTGPSGGGMESNVFQGAFDLWVNNRLTGYSWYVFLTNAPSKAIAIQQRQGLRNNFFNEANSHDLADNNIREMMWDERKMIFPWNPHNTIKVNQ